MSWTSVPDKAAGDVFTAAMWNTYIRDNLNSGVPVLLGDTTLGATASEILFSDISQEFTNLRLVCYLRCNNASSSATINMQWNGDTGSNYDYQLIQGFGSSVGAGEGFTNDRIPFGDAPAGSAGANLFSTSFVEIPHYANTLYNKSCAIQNALKYGTSSGNMFTQMVGGFWRNGAAITSIRIFPAAGSWVSGCRVTLYGVP